MSIASTCPICLYPLNENIIDFHHGTNPVPHYFHESCIQSWSGNCPICRQPINMPEIHNENPQNDENIPDSPTLVRQFGYHFNPNNP